MSQCTKIHNIRWALTRTLSTPNPKVRTQYLHTFPQTGVERTEHAHIRYHPNELSTTHTPKNFSRHSPCRQKLMLNRGIKKLEMKSVFRLRVTIRTENRSLPERLALDQNAWNLVSSLVGWGKGYTDRWVCDVKLKLGSSQKRFKNTVFVKTQTVKNHYYYCQTTPINSISFFGHQKLMLLIGIQKSSHRRCSPFVPKVSIWPGFPKSIRSDSLGAPDNQRHSNLRTTLVGTFLNSY